MVQKWQGESSKNGDAGTSKNTNELTAQQAQGKKTEGPWQHVTTKSVSKEVASVSTSRAMEIKNGFKSLATTGENLKTDTNHRVKGKGGRDTNPKIAK